MTDASARLPWGTILTAFVATAAMYVTLSSFGFALVDMQVDLGFSTDDVNALAYMPAAGALLVVFVAGSLADRWGPRRLLILGLALYTTGAAVIGLAPSVAWIIVGRILDGVGGVSMAIVALSIINSTVRNDGQRARIFGVYAAITPLTFLLVPPLSAAIVESVGWRAVAVAPVLLGVGTLLAALRFVPRQRAGTSGELWTPLLAGVALAGFALGMMNLSSNRALFAGAFAAATVAAIALVVLMRRLEFPTLRLGWCRERGMAILLVAIAVAAMPNLFFYTNLLLQYRYTASLVTIALLLMVPQASAVIGGLLSGPVSARIGPARAATGALFLTAVMSLSTLFVSGQSPIWVPLLCLALIVAPMSFMIGPLTNTLLSRAPVDVSGAASSVRKATWTLGSVLGGAVTGAFAFGAFQARLTDILATDGMSSQEAAGIAQMIRDGAIVDKLALTLSNPIAREDLMSRGPGLLEAQSYAFTVVGLVSAVIYLLAGVLMLAYLRRVSPDRALP